MPRPVVNEIRDHVHQSNLIERINDKCHDIVGESAYRLLCSWPRLTEKRILAIHLIVTSLQPMSSRHRGQYRDEQVTIGGRLGAPIEKIQTLMDAWIYDMSCFRQHNPKEMHVRFEKIHPFIDGNGRVGRLLMWWHQRRIKRPPLMILGETEQQRRQYYDWFY